jgi:hypothetical protein
MTKKKIAYHPCPLKKIISVNNLEFEEVIISTHYEEKHGSYMTDEKILAIVKQLDGKSGFIPHRQGQLPNGTV